MGQGYYCKGWVSIGLGLWGLGLPPQVPSQANLNTDKVICSAITLSHRPVHAASCATALLIRYWPTYHKTAFFVEGHVPTMTLLQTQPRHDMDLHKRTSGHFALPSKFGALSPIPSAAAHIPHSKPLT